MDRRSIALALALLLGPVAAHAGYAQLSPPPGWTAGTGPGGSIAGAAANDATAGGWRATTSLNTGGRAVQIPAAGRFAANAGRFAARGLMLNPLALGVAGAAFLASQCFAYQGGQWVRTCGGTLPPVSDGFQYQPVRTWGGGGVQPIFKTNAEACDSMRPLAELAWKQQNPSGTVLSSVVQACTATGYTVRVNWKINTSTSYQDYSGSISRTSNASCPAGWYITPAGCVQTPPPQTVTQEEIETAMEPIPIPPALPQQIPGVPLPIELPSINPTPGTDPTPQPLRIPQGNPVPVPNTDPQQYQQPFLRVTPVPTPSNPWQVDLTPEDVISNSPTPVLDPQTVGGAPDPNTVPKEEQFDLCKEHPDIVACAKLGELAADTVKNENVPLSITPDAGFPSGGACPAPKVHQLMGRSFSFSVQPICDFATLIKPLLIGFAWLTAALTFLGVARREN